MWGADAGQLVALAARLEGQADEIDRAQRALTGRLRSAPWQGPGADRYRQRWESADRRQVIAAAGFLRDSARELRANATQQQQASAGATGGIGAMGQASAAASAPAAVSAATGAEVLLEGFSEIFPLLLEFIDEAELAGGLVGTALGPILGIFNLGMGVTDLLYDHPYEGNFGVAESIADVLKIAGAAVGLAGLAATATGVGAPVGFALKGIGIVLGGTGMLIDLGLKGWDDFGRDGVRWLDRQWDQSARVLDRAWDTAYSTAEDAAAAALDSVDRSVDVAVDVASRGIDLAFGAGERVVDGVVDQIGDNWRTVTSWL